MTAPQPAPAAADAREGERVSVGAAALRAMVAARFGTPEFHEAATLVAATARPLPAAAGAVDAAALVLSALGEIRAVADTLSVCGSGTGATKMRQMATALRAACDALSTAAAPVRPSREAVEALVKTIRLGIPLPGCMTGPSEPCGACRTCKAWSACAALMALVPFAPPADAQAVEA